MTPPAIAAGATAGTAAGTVPLAASGLVLAYERTVVVDGLSVEFAPGSITALIGPNGCGKSTLLRAFARVLAPRAGAVQLGGIPLATLATREIAKSLSYLPQTPTAPPGLTVRELVTLGRFPHRRGLGGATAVDRQAVGHALAAVGLAGQHDVDLDQLSGGQRQRAWIGMALCQEAAVLLLDEPTSHLDPAHQLEVMLLLRRVAAAGRTVVVVLHDLQLAARHADRLIALADGRIAAHGVPSDVITPTVLERVFAIRADVIADPLTGTPICLPRGLTTG